jgi:DnaJ-class molecular chaperone
VCEHCAGTGECAHTHHFRLALPPGVADGARFRFVVAPPSARATRVEVTVSVA